MVQLLLISFIVAIALHDSGVRAASCAEPVGWLWTLLPFAVIALIVQLFIAWCGRRLDATGRGRYIARADQVLSMSRLATAVVHGWAVLSGGWMETVRASIGEVVLLDKLVVIAPAVTTLALGWASYYGIDRRLREATLMGLLDTGSPVRSLPTRWEYVSDQIRHQVLIILGPMAVVTAWAGGLEKLAYYVRDTRPELARQAWVMWTFELAQLGGIILLLALMPLGLRLVWRTVRLGPGAIRERLEALCTRQGVRCRDFLVWRTHTDMVNGALVGIVPGLRYILLTDALLERLNERQVEAVMAHEVAHARRHHIPWLLVCVVSSVAIASVIVEGAARVLLRDGARIDWWQRGWGEGIGAPLSLGAGLMVFGWVSRRFEQQADAFAAQHLSGFRAPRPSAQPMPAISGEAVEAMSGALLSVARLAHMPEGKFSFRHGSILTRCRNLQGISGMYANRLPIDRTVRRIKLAAAVGLASAIGLVVYTSGAGGSPMEDESSGEGAVQVHR